jgi:hypothetical protein
MYLSAGFPRFPFPDCPFPSHRSRMCATDCSLQKYAILPSDTLVIFLVKGVLNDH